MATLADMKKYLGYEFSSGAYTGQDYRTFQTKYINYLRGICKKQGWQLVDVSRNHYCFSAFIKSAEGKFAYLSISDVRFFRNEWFDNVLFRTAAHERDYTGGWNQYTSLPRLHSDVARLFTQDGGF